MDLGKIYKVILCNLVESASNQIKEQVSKIISSNINAMVVSSMQSLKRLSTHLDEL